MLGTSTQTATAGECYAQPCSCLLETALEHPGLTELHPGYDQLEWRLEVLADRRIFFEHDRRGLEVLICKIKSSELDKTPTTVLKVSRSPEESHRFGEQGPLCCTVRDGQG